MLSNAYFLAKFRFDTAENEPAKNLQNLLIFPMLLTLTPINEAAERRGDRCLLAGAAGARPRGPVAGWGSGGPGLLWALGGAVDA